MILTFCRPRCSSGARACVRACEDTIEIAPSLRSIPQSPSSLLILSLLWNIRPAAGLLAPRNVRKTIAPGILERPKGIAYEKGSSVRVARSRRAKAPVSTSCSIPLFPSSSERRVRCQNISERTWRTRAARSCPSLPLPFLSLFLLVARVAVYVHIRLTETIDRNTRGNAGIYGTTTTIEKRGASAQLNEAAKL